MSDIFKYLKAYYDRAFHPGYFVLVVALMATLIYLNYWHQLERKYAAGGSSWWSGFSGYYLLYAIPFVLAFLLQLFFTKEAAWVKNPWFWTILLLAPAIFAFRVNFNFHQLLIERQWAMPERLFYQRCINWVLRVFVVLLPILVIWWLKDRGTQPFYGTAPLQSVRPYLWMLVLMIPLIALASTQADFLHTYPKAKVLEQVPGGAWITRWRYIIYELCYGFDFVSIEFFFRGFLILALLRICGMQCILPVACFYCTIHFGKPMGEAISSFFGGLLLGIISFHTGSIWGGLLVHLGIAWMMELGGWLGHFFRR